MGWLINYESIYIQPFVVYIYNKLVFETDLQAVIKSQFSSN